MKSVLMLATLTFSLIAFSDEQGCSDTNFDVLGQYSSYGDIVENDAFELLFKTHSPAPIGFPEMFGEGEDTCRDVTATYFKHAASGKKYVMYTTHDDYCDGGNTIGLVIDLVKYSDENSKFSDSIVGEIGDSDFYCR